MRRQVKAAEYGEGAKVKGSYGWVQKSVGMVQAVSGKFRGHGFQEPEMGRQ